MAPNRIERLGDEARSCSEAPAHEPWEEVEKVLKARSATQLSFDAEALVKRVQKFGDLFELVLKLKQKLPKISPEPV